MTMMSRDSGTFGESKTAERAARQEGGRGGMRVRGRSIIVVSEQWERRQAFRTGKRDGTATGEKERGVEKRLAARFQRCREKHTKIADEDLSQPEGPCASEA
jgi:hypothetical protein